MTVVVAGEALVDLAPHDGGTLRPLLGGSPYNVAVGLGRLGIETSYLGTLSTDAFGRRLGERLEADGVRLDATRRTDAPTTLAVVHLDDQGRASYAFYLEGTSAGGFVAEPASLPDGAALHVSLGAVTFETQPAGRTTRELLEREAGRRVTCLDPNVRPTVIEDLRRYAGTVDELVAGIDLVKVSDEDLRLLHPDRDAEAVAGDWAASGPALVVVTLGPDGCLALTHDGRRVDVPGRDVEVVDTVGAGDAFTSGLLAWLDRSSALADRDALRHLDDDALREALRYAVRVAAVTCTRPGADPPRHAELVTG